MIVAVPLGLLVYTMYQEGVFETTRNSVLILVAGVNRFRRLGKDDMFEVEEMNLRNEELSRAVESQRREEEERRRSEKEARKSKKRKK